MARTYYSDSILKADDFIDRFNSTLASIDADLPGLIEFRLQIQKDNLRSLIEEADNKIQKYENIYPYIKELCRDQTINPELYKSIEKVLNWALKKGRGKGGELPKDIKNSWITYIVLLSCSMIDSNDDKEVGNLQFRTSKGNLARFTRNN